MAWPVVRRPPETLSATYARRATVDRGSDRGSIPRASMAKPSEFLGVFVVLGPWVVPWGIPYSVRREPPGARLEVSGGRRYGYFCALSGRCALVSGSNGFGYPGPISGVQSRMDNVIMQRGVMRCGSQSNPRLADAVYAGICFRGEQSRRLGT